MIECNKDMLHMTLLNLLLLLTSIQSKEPSINGRLWQYFSYEKAKKETWTILFNNILFKTDKRSLSIEHATPWYYENI